MGGKRSPEILCISCTPQIVRSIQHSVFIMDDTLSQISQTHKMNAGQDNYMRLERMGKRSNKFYEKCPDKLQLF